MSEFAGPSSPAAPVLGYASVPPLSGLAPLVEWREAADGSVEMVLYPGPTWRPIAFALIGLAVQLFAAPFVALLVEAAMPAEQMRLGRAATVCIAAWVACVARTGWRVRRLRRATPEDRVGRVRAGPDGLTVTAPPLAGGRVATWPRDRVVGLRCELVGFARGLQEYLRLAVELSDGHVERATLPWPPETGMADVESRLRAALGLRAGDGEAAGGLTRAVRRDTGRAT